MSQQARNTSQQDPNARRDANGGKNATVGYTDRPELYAETPKKANTFGPTAVVVAVVLAVGIAAAGYFQGRHSVMSQNETQKLPSRELVQPPIAQPVLPSAPVKPVADSGHAFSLTRVSYDRVSFRVQEQESNTHNAIFSADGTKMYVSGASTNTIYEYQLAKAWDLSSAAYSGQSLFVGDKESDGGGITFSTDGTHLYVAGSHSNKVWRYDLSEPWSVTSAQFSGQSFDLSPNIHSAGNLQFNTDGTKLFITDWRAHLEFEYVLQTPWDVSSAALKSWMRFDSKGVPADSLSYFSADGKNMYAHSFGRAMVYRFTLSTPWDLQTASFTGESFSVRNEDPGNHGVFLSGDGKKMFMLGWANGQVVYQYSLGDSQNVNSATSDSKADDVGAVNSRPKQE